MTNNLKILHIEDIPSDAELVERTLKKSGIAFEKRIVDTRAEFTKALIDFRPDIILSDHSLPTFNSLEALKILKATKVEIPFILITSTVSEEFAVNVMKEGASDYILKDRLQRLPNAIINALQKHQSDIERQIYLNKIVESEALFTKAESIAEFGTWRVDIKANTINWSSGVYPLLGYKKDEITPSFESFLKNIYPDDVSRVKSIFKNAGKIHITEVAFRIINKDGSIRYLHSQCELEVDKNGEPAFIIGFNQDVTKSMLAQIEIQKNIEELQAASARQSAILNALPPNIVLLNESGKIVAVNESWRKFTLENNLGIPKYGIDYSYIAISEKATGVDKTSGKQIADGIEEVIAGKRDEFSMEYSCFSKQKKIWFQLVVAPLTDKTKKGAVVLHIDITSRKLAEESMFKSEANLKTIFENTDVAYVLCDAEHKIISFNSRANELCLEQFNKKLKAGGNTFSYFPKNKIPNVKQAIQRVLNSEMISYETSYNLIDGSIKWYEARWVNITNEKEENIGFMLAFKDITERKIADMERDKITADLVQRNKDLEQFTYIVSHNLRAPVANIIGLSNMINSADEDFKEDEEIKSALTTSINILDQTIIDLNHILQVSTLINEKTEVVSFQSLVTDIMLSLNNIIKNENASITFNFKAADNMITIKSYIHSIFYNLIINAIKFKRPDVDPVLYITTKRTGNKLEIQFKDNGKGIAEKNFKNLFGLYRRFDTSVEGKGMGLFMVKMQVESLGGKINVESNYGSGSIFTIEFSNFKHAV
jgi:PAS domain S-box-containing protein